MLTMSVNDARDNIADLWASASREPVIVESAGDPVAVVLSPSEYERLTHARKARVPGTMREMFEGVDVNVLLATPIDGVFEDHA